jgi:hypothetical protein
MGVAAVAATLAVLDRSPDESAPSGGEGEPVPVFAGPVVDERELGTPVASVS